MHLFGEHICKTTSTYKWCCGVTSVGDKNTFNLGSVPASTAATSTSTSPGS